MSRAVVIEDAHRQGLTLADVEAWAKEARDAGARDSTLVYGSSRMSGKLRRLRLIPPARFAEREVHKNV